MIFRSTLIPAKDSLSSFVDNDQGLLYSFGSGPSSFDRCLSSSSHAP
jgi:hypothetical protein